MDPFTLTMILVALFVGGGGLAFIENVLLPRKRIELEGVKKVHSERVESRRLELESAKAQDKALTMEDRIWLWDNGHTKWDPDEQPGVAEVLAAYTKYDENDKIDPLDPLENYWWELPKWYVDFASTRPEHNEVAAMFYKWALEGKDVDETLAEMKATHFKKIKDREDEKIRLGNERAAKLKADAEAVLRELKRQEEERAERKRLKKLEDERQLRERIAKRKAEAQAREAKRKEMLGLKGDYTDTIAEIMKTQSFREIGYGYGTKAFAPGHPYALAIKKLQLDNDLPVTGVVDSATLKVMSALSRKNNIIPMRAKYNAGV